MKPRCLAMLVCALAGLARPAAVLGEPGDAADYLAPPPSMRLPAEFERQQAIIFAPDTRLDGVDAETFARIFAALPEDLTIIAVLPEDFDRDEFRRELARYGFQRDGMRLIALPYQSSWIRDYGPVFLQRDGRLLATDAEYRRGTRWDEDRMPGALAGHLQTNVTAAPLLIEGGNLLSNGRGLILTTTIVLRDNTGGFDPASARGRSYDEAMVHELFRRHFGSTEVVFLEPLRGESTGHVDIFAAFTAVDTVVVGSYHPAVDPVNADILDRNAERLSKIVTPAGPLKVVRIPMPTNRDGVFRTYTNVTFANCTLLVPSYPGVDFEAEREAMAVYRQLLPDWKIVPVDISRLIHKGGGLHCLSVNVPHGAPMPAE
jgi:agmatine/peptidylarginine deiminase